MQLCKYASEPLACSRGTRPPAPPLKLTAAILYPQASSNNTCTGKFGSAVVADWSGFFAAGTGPSVLENSGLGRVPGFCEA